MANKKTRERISRIADVVIADKLTACLDLAESLEQGKSAEEKSLEKTIGESPSDAVKEACQARLAELQSTSTKSLDEVLTDMETIGLVAISIIQGGLIKYAGSASYQHDPEIKARLAAKKEAEAEEGNGDEFEVEGSIETDESDI